MKKLFLVLTCLICVGCDSVSPVFTVSSGDRAIITQNGKIVGEPKEPGLHYKVPFIQKVHIFQIARVEKITIPFPKTSEYTVEIWWRIEDSKKYYLASLENNILDHFKKLVSDKFNEIIINYDADFIRLFSEDIHIDEKMKNKKYLSLLTDLQEAVVNLGIKIHVYSFLKNSKNAQPSASLDSGHFAALTREPSRWPALQNDASYYQVGKNVRGYHEYKQGHKKI